MKALLVLLSIGILVSAPQSRAEDAELDHLLCYRMRDPLSVEAKFDLLARLQPEFSRRGCKLVLDDDGDGVKSQFCVPASKRNVLASEHNPDFGGPPLSADYICYRVDCDTGVRPPNKTLEDQFGRRMARFGAPVRVCVPARKEPVKCGPTETGSTGPQCGGECPAADQRCRYDRTTNMCSCAPAECRRPDAAGMCGGRCPDPNDECVAEGNNRCDCRPRRCGIDPLTMQCGGPCLTASEICTFDAAGDCACQPPPPPECGRDPANGECGGPCPVAGDRCATAADTFTLPHATSSRAAPISLAASVVTYTPLQAGIVDGFVYVVDDGNGGKNHNVITVKVKP